MIDVYKVQQQECKTFLNAPDPQYAARSDTSQSPASSVLPGVHKPRRAASAGVKHQKWRDVMVINEEYHKTDTSLSSASYPTSNMKQSYLSNKGVTHSQNLVKCSESPQYSHYQPDANIDQCFATGKRQAWATESHDVRRKPYDEDIQKEQEQFTTHKQHLATQTQHDDKSWQNGGVMRGVHNRCTITQERDNLLVGIIKASCKL